MEELRIEYLPVDALTPYERNARKHAEADVEAIMRSIEEFGFDDPIGIWGEDNIIVEGHGRLEAAKQLAMETVPVIRLDHLTDEQRRAYALAHNKTAELSSWDFDALADELADLAADFDMAAMGFEEMVGGNAAESVNIDDYGTDFELPDGDAPNQKKHTLVLTNEQDVEFMAIISKIERGDCETTGGNDIGDRVFEGLKRWARLETSNCG